ncbi:MAG: hypothetical protein KDC52_00800, partial [Ignavibacteriae bacterium]|nr:hypothetical protein [Ignavibacteriota bacterium]
MNLIKMFLGKYENEVKSVLEKYENENVAKRIWEKDHTVWSDSPEEVTNRLDWLISPEETLSKIEEVNAFVEDIKSAGFTHALLLGMGGSSLAPEVFSFSFGTKEGFLNLQVLDSTDPGAVL